MDKDIEIAKIVANSTPTSWSQAYNAGKLFAVISLTSVTPAEENSLNTLGKEVLDNLEAEYFALETKDQESIGNAVRTSIEKIPQGIKSSFVVGSFVADILYVFAKNGKVDMKRKEALGKILEAGETVESSSGFLENGDIILLETSEFVTLVSPEALASSIDSQPITQIAENLAPMVHEKAEGGASAIILKYKKEVLEEPILPVEQGQTEEPQAPPEAGQTESKIASSDILKKYFFSVLDKTQKFRTPSFDRSKKTVLLVTAILILVFLGSIVFALKKQSDEKTKALVAQYYTPAVKKYEEGQSLLGLNESLARDSFMASQRLLLEGSPKLKGSSEEKKVSELLGKVNKELEETANIKTVTPVEAKASDSKLLTSEQGSGILFAAKEDSDIYTLDASGVNKNSKSIIKKTWGTPGGLGVYFGNIYVLDKTAKQIFKFVSTSSGYVKTNYFKDTSPGISTSNSIAIDGSIWVLLNDGTVMKFTRGNSDNFSLSGLDKAFSSPTRIFTNVGLDNVYILDNGNSRIVAFDKTGAYKEQYQNSIFKNAKDIEVTKDKIFILSGSKLYSIEL